MSPLFMVFIIIYCFSFYCEHNGREMLLQKTSLVYRSGNDEAKSSMTLREYVSRRADNGTILLMMVDYGYLNMFVNSYLYANLSQYQNLVVMCIDERSYNVGKVNQLKQ